MSRHSIQEMSTEIQPTSLSACDSLLKAMSTIYANANEIEVSNAYIIKAFDALRAFIALRLKKENIIYSFFFNNIDEGKLKLSTVFTLQDLIDCMVDVNQQNISEKSVPLFTENEINLLESSYPRFCRVLESSFQDQDLESGKLKQEDKLLVSPLFSYKPEGLFIKLSPVILQKAPELEPIQEVILKTVVDYHVQTSKFEEDRESLSLSDFVVENRFDPEQIEKINREDLIEGQILDKEVIEDKIALFRHYIHSIISFADNDETETFFENLSQDISWNKFILLMTQSWFIANLNQVKNGFVWDKKTLRVEINKFIISLMGLEIKHDRSLQVLGGLFRNFFNSLRKLKNRSSDLFLNLIERRLLKDPFEGMTFDELLEKGYISQKSISRFNKILTHKEYELFSVPRTYQSEQTVLSTLREKFLKRDYSCFKDLRNFNNSSRRIMRSEVFERYLTSRMISFATYRREEERKIISAGINKPQLCKIRDLSVLNNQITDNLGIEGLTDSFSFLLAYNGLYFNNTNPNFGYNFFSWKKREENRQTWFEGEYLVPESYIEVCFNYTRQNKINPFPPSYEELEQLIKQLAVEAGELMTKTYSK